MLIFFYLASLSKSIFLIMYLIKQYGCRFVIRILRYKLTHNCLLENSFFQLLWKLRSKNA